MIIFLIFFILGWGIGVHAKNAMATAAREAARAYATTHDEETARNVAADMAKNILGANVSDDIVERFKANNVYLRKLEINGQNYCQAIVVFKLPIPAWTGVNVIRPGGIKVGGEAIFKEEYNPNDTSGSDTA